MRASNTCAISDMFLGIIIAIILMLLVFVGGYKTSNTCHSSSTSSGRVCGVLLKGLK